jgi:predicted ATPase
MKTLYLENYKGFNKVFLPILDVNFFVGENSTGKTAILNLINLLSDPKFWFYTDFNNDIIELGYFDEIVNQYSKDKSFFKIGIEFEDNSENNKITHQFILMTFTNKDSIPILNELKITINNRNILVNLTNKKITYKINDVFSNNFQEWIDDDVFSGKNMILANFNLGRQMPIEIIVSLLRSKIKDLDKTSKNNFDFIGITSRTISNSVIWLAPIRAKAKRTYDSYKQSFSPEGEHIPFILRNIFTNKKNDRSKNIIQYINEFGIESALFDEIKINELGKTKSSPFTIEVIYNSHPIKITNVGYGVSQIIPLLIEILTSDKSILAIQQPEVHLHPKAQAAFGKLIFDSACNNKNKFIIETHSDFTINRFRLNLKNSTSNDKPSSQVVFFERDSNGTNFTSLVFDEKGKYPNDVPINYGKFFIDEELKMIEF